MSVMPVVFISGGRETLPPENLFSYYDVYCYVLRGDISERVGVVLKRIPADVNYYRTWSHKDRSTIMLVVNLDELSSIEDVVKILRTYFLDGMIRVVQIGDNKFIIHVFVQAR